MAGPPVSWTPLPSRQLKSPNYGPSSKPDFAKEILMPRNAPAPLDAGIVKVRKGEAQPHAAPQVGRLKAVEGTENRIGITVRFPASMHERLRVLAFERRTSKQAL